MARASTITKLPIDRWFEIIGIHPFHANQLVSNTYLIDTTCGLGWYQYAWQNADRLSREDIAIAIRSAEDAIEAEVGYKLLPDWTVDERMPYARPSVPEIWSASDRNVRGGLRSLRTKWGYVINGGKRVKTGIETAAVVRSDADGDGYAELVTVTVGTSVTDPDEIRVYYPGESAADEWEIRPINVSIAANVATITFKSWQIVDPDLQEYLDAGESSNNIDAETAGNYLTTVDVYRVWNDPQDMFRFLWENDAFTCSCGSSTCSACTLGTQTGCFHMRNPRLGIIVPAPGTWNASDNAYDTAEFSVSRGPDQARVWYYSGNRDMSLAMPKTHMEKFWEHAVAYYAASLLDKDGCDCSNAMEFIWNWRTDVAHVGPTRGGYSTTPGQLGNPLGTTKGALYAWNRIHQNGRKIGK